MGKDPAGCRYDLSTNGDYCKVLGNFQTVKAIPYLSSVTVMKSPATNDNSLLSAASKSYKARTLRSKAVEEGRAVGVLAIFVDGYIEDDDKDFLAFSCFSASASEAAIAFAIASSS